MVPLVYYCFLFLTPSPYLLLACPLPSNCQPQVPLSRPALLTAMSRHPSSSTSRPSPIFLPYTMLETSRSIYACSSSIIIPSQLCVLPLQGPCSIPTTVPVSHLPPTKPHLLSRHFSRPPPIVRRPAAVRRPQSNGAAHMFSQPRKTRVSFRTWFNSPQPHNQVSNSTPSSANRRVPVSLSRRVPS